MTAAPLTVAIVDYGLCNLFSVKHACEHVGFKARITSAPDAIREADGVILPGVGAFENAMCHLRDNGLADTIREIAAAGKPLVGICLGMQLLMSESHEFGIHTGLDIVPGRVLGLGGLARGKVPHIGWSRIHRPQGAPEAQWGGTPLAEVADGEYMYFVHSYYVEPEDAGLAVSTTEYGGVKFCSSLIHGNIFACQYHPERSGPQGVAMYQSFAKFICAVKG